MENQISTSHNQDFGRYLQSLDSVRFSESDSNALIIQARVELFASLLFGQTVPIGEHQFLDSDGFITNAVNLIESQKTIDDPKDRRKVETIFPFRVGIRAAYSNIDNFIAIKLGDVNYKLSRWRSLDKTHGIRNQIKKKHEDGEFQFDDLYNLLPGESDSIDELKLIRDRFRGGEAGKFHTYYRKPTVMVAPQIPLLSQGLREITGWDEAFLIDEINLQQKLEVNGYEPREMFDPNLLKPAIELIEILKSLGNAGVSFENRSHVRKEESGARKIVPENNKFGAILEIYDRLYNSAAANAVGSHSEGVSSARDIQDDFVKAASLLADLAINEITTNENSNTRQTSGVVRDIQWAHNTNFGVLKDTKEELILEKMPWNIIWQAYLDPKWEKSQSDLNNAFILWDKLIKKPTKKPSELMSIDHQLDEAISRHIENMTRLLSGSILQMHKDSKSGDIIFDYVSTAGPLVTVAAQFIMNKLGYVTSEESTYIWTLSAAAQPVLGALLKYNLPKAKAWRTRGQIRRMFEKIQKPVK